MIYPLIILALGINLDLKIIVVILAELVDQIINTSGTYQNIYIFELY